jgi:hypothetical protein
MRTIWIMLPDRHGPVAIEYDAKAQKTYSTFEAFCANFRTGWELADGKEITARWAVTNSRDIEPLIHEWKQSP